VRDTMIIAPPLVISHEQIDELAEKAGRCLDLTFERCRAEGRLGGKGGSDQGVGGSEDAVFMRRRIAWVRVRLASSLPPTPYSLPPVSWLGRAIALYSTTCFSRCQTG